VRDGKRLELPNCDENLRQVIKRCWDQTPSQRPEFRELLPMLASLVPTQIIPIQPTVIVKCEYKEIIADEDKKRVAVCFVDNLANRADKFTDALKQTPDRSYVATTTITCPQVASHDFMESSKDIVAKSEFLIAIISKDCFNYDSFVNLIAHASEKSVHVVMVHDQQSCKFPNETEQPQLIRHVFTSIAVTYLEKFAKQCWVKLIKKIRTNVNTATENVSTDLFLSHRQKTGQGIALTLWSELKNSHKVFLDVKSSFELHDLPTIVEKTKLFIFIITEGIFDSKYCFTEFQTAISNNKSILILLDSNYSLPSEIPNLWQKYWAFIADNQTTFAATYLEDCIIEIEESLASISEISYAVYAQPVVVQ